jgi:putative acetyltransferase
MKIEIFSPEQTGEVKELVLGVLTQKGFEYDPDKDSDLDDIRGYYHDRGGMFFIGTVDGKIIGTSAVSRIDSEKCKIQFKKLIF